MADEKLPATFTPAQDGGLAALGPEIDKRLEQMARSGNHQGVAVVLALAVIGRALQAGVQTLAQMVDSINTVARRT